MPRRAPGCSWRFPIRPVAGLRRALLLTLEEGSGTSNSILTASPHGWWLSSSDYLWQHHEGVLREGEGSALAFLCAMGR